MPKVSSLELKQTTLPNAISLEPAGNWSSLHDAASRGDENLVQTLLVRQMDNTVKEFKYGNTPLHEAAARGYSRCVKILCVPATAVTTQKPKDRHHKEVAKKTESSISAHRSMLNLQNYAGFTALHLAAQNGHNQSCRELLLAGVDPDIENYYGDTALHTACRYGHAGTARILLSALCNVNKGNLNGDTALHITCAMGRHKLTRILLEAECAINVKNAQGETPRDIAIRKGYARILDILNNPHRMRNKRGKHEENNCDSKPVLFEPKYVAGIKNISWSPYGCHYFPDPRSFPSPKLETLPKEPLKNGEQYYLDLAGHIRKGPIGIGNVCYCGPFFKNIEDKINSNKKQLKKYVHNAKEDLGDKVQALAARTNEQIEKLTLSMIADRVQCENRRKYLESYLTRSDSLRLTAEHIPKLNHTKKEENRTMKRCQSLEFLERDESLRNGLSNSKSYDVLKDATSSCAAKFYTEGGAQSKTRTVASGMTKNEFHNVTMRLGDLLAKTNSLLEVPEKSHAAATSFSNSRHTGHPNITAETNSTTRSDMHEIDVRLSAAVRNNDPLNVTADTSLSKTNNLHEAGRIAKTPVKTEMEKCTCCNDKSTKLFEEDYENVYGFQNRNRLEYFYATDKSGYMLQDVISALRKDHKAINSSVDIKTLNESENNYEDKLGYKDENCLINSKRLFKTHSGICQIERRDLGSSEELICDRNQQTQNQVLKKCQSSWAEHTTKSKCNVAEYPNAKLLPNTDTSHGIRETSIHVDGNAQELDQNKSSDAFICKPSAFQPTTDASTKKEPFMMLRSLSPHFTESSDSMSPNSALYPNERQCSNVKLQRFVPKDAYFHDLPGKKNSFKEESSITAYNSDINYNRNIESNACIEYAMSVQPIYKQQPTSKFVSPVQALIQSSFANAVNGKSIPPPGDVEFENVNDISRSVYMTEPNTAKVTPMENSAYVDIGLASNTEGLPSVRSDIHLSYSKNAMILTDNLGIAELHTNNISSLV